MVSKESTALTVWFQLILMDTLQSNCSVQAVFSCKCSLFIVAFNKLSVRVWTAYLGYSVCVCECVLLSQASVQGPEGQQLLIPHFCSEASLAPVAWQPCVFRRGGGVYFAQERGKELHEMWMKLSTWDACSSLNTLGVSDGRDHGILQCFIQRCSSSAY